MKHIRTEWAGLGWGETAFNAVGDTLITCLATLLYTLLRVLFTTRLTSGGLHRTPLSPTLARDRKTNIFALLKTRVFSSILLD